MDILSIDSDLFRSRYNWTSGDYSVTAELFGSDNSHWMSNFHLRRPPQNAATMADDPMRFRQTYAVSDNMGFSLKLEQFVANGSWQYGIDGHFTDVFTVSSSHIDCIALNFLVTYYTHKRCF